MTSHPAFRKFAFAYAISFAVLYAVVRAKGLALFTFYPTLGVVLVGLHRSRDVADPALEFLAPRDVLVRLDCDGSGWGTSVRLCRRAATRTMWALVLARVVVGDPPLGNDRVRLPDNSLVSAVAAISASCP